MDRETESRSGNREAKKLLGKALGLDIWVLGLVLGPLGGITIFIATTWLIIR
ncbi:MAG: hypothetical protein PVH41_07830 [Anaerolineae bacterium]